jgi:hypothetical protein
MDSKGNMPVLVAALLFLTGTTVVMGAVMTYNAGTVRVSVQEKKPGGQNVRVIVPAVVIGPAVELIPARELERHAEDLRPWLPAIRIASKSLSEAPDAVLVEVIDSHDHVVITKRGGSLLVDVTSDDADVHVAVPLKLVQTIAERMEEGSPPV